MGPNLGDLAGWLALGAVLGFLYAWRNVKSPPGGNDQSYMKGYIFGARATSGLIFACLGAIGGAMVWSAAALLYWAVT